MPFYCNMRTEVVTDCSKFRPTTYYMNWQAFKIIWKQRQFWLNSHKYVVAVYCPSFPPNPTHFPCVQTKTRNMNMCEAGKWSFPAAVVVVVCRVFACHLCVPSLVVVCLRSCRCWTCPWKHCRRSAASFWQLTFCVATSTSFSPAELARTDLRSLWVWFNLAFL